MDPKRQLTNDCGDPRTNVKNEDSNDSVISVIFPWRARRADTRRPIVPRNETGTTVTTVGFYMCMMSVMLLSTGIGLSAASLWVLIYKIPYVYITGGSFLLDIDSFTLMAGILAFPCCWIAWVCHDNKKHYAILPLLIVLLSSSVGVLSTGLGIGFVTKSKMNFDRRISSPKLMPGHYRTVLNQTMMYTMMNCANFNLRSSWNIVQKRLKCCGVEQPSDWLKFWKDLPHTCYLNEKQSLPKILFVRGCLDMVSSELAWETCFLTGLSFIGFCVNVVTALLVTFVYVNDRMVSSRNVMVVD